MKKLPISFQALKYHVARSTDLEPSVIIEKILSKLKAEKYRVTKVTKSSVTFDDWRVLIMSRIKAFRRLDGGEFEISNSDNGVVVSFNYHLNTLPYLLVVGALVVSLIYDRVTMTGYSFLLHFFRSGALFKTSLRKMQAKKC